MSEPRTVTGVLLLDTLNRGLKLFPEDRRAAIAAIEAEAAAMERKRLRDEWESVLARLDELGIGGPSAAFGMAVRGSQILAEPES